MQLNNRCLRCGSASNLNTTMVVSIVGTKYDVILCDDHEDTSPKQAKEIVSLKITEFEELKKRLGEFGMDVNAAPTSGGIVILEKPQAVPVPAVVAVPSVPLIEVAYKKPNKEVEVGSLKEEKDFDKKGWAVAPFGGVAKGITAQVNLETRQSVDVGAAVQREHDEGMRKGKIAADTKMPRMASRVEKVQTVRGRGGKPMTIPKVIKHAQGGNTIINVVDTGGDRTIQDRFRAIADPIHNYSNGYDVDNCTLCSGTGISATTQNSCPKCQGTGILNKGWNGASGR